VSDFLEASVSGDNLSRCTYHHTKNIECEFDRNELTCRLEGTSQPSVSHKHCIAISIEPVSSCTNVRMLNEAIGMTKHQW
jgi:hypothetical protein